MKQVYFINNGKDNFLKDFGVIINQQEGFLFILPDEPAKQARKEDLAFEWRMGCAVANVCSISFLEGMSIYFLKSGINKCCINQHCINISTCVNLEPGQLCFE